MYNAQFFILITIAIFNLIMGSVINTNNLKSALIFKVIPIMSAFYLGLLAFKVV